MRNRFFHPVPVVLLASICLWAGSVRAQGAAPIAQDKIEALEAALATHSDATSAARQRLAVKRMIRDGGELLEANPAAPNRFDVLGLIFTAQQKLLAMEDSSRNREALLDTCKRLAKAPDEYAKRRLDAELLLSQTELARQGANADARLAALKPMIERYRDTPAEAKMLRIAMVMALEAGDARLIRDLRETMAERFAGDHEMIAFQRAKLGGQVFGAPLCGIFERPDGSTVRFPTEAMGRASSIYFWSTEDGGMADLQALAAAWKERKADADGRLAIYAVNLDGLPDGGEKILRDLGVDWTVLILPDGRENPIYTTFARRDPALITVTPTGYAALIMAGATRKLSGTTGPRDYTRWVNSTLAREWTRAKTATQLTSLFAGDCFVVDAEGAFDPALPPEIKARSKSVEDPLSRTADSVPEATLRAIQDCFVLPPLRYRMTAEEVRSNCRKAVELCDKAIAAHPQAPDVWIVRNRRIVALLTLWKLDADRAHFEHAVAEARVALDADMPPGTDVVARYCLAQDALRDPEKDPKQVIADFAETLGGANAPGPALAAASMLALGVGERQLHEAYRERILAGHADRPMMWTFVAFLRNRYNRYWLYRVPFVAGWSYGRRQDFFLSLGETEDFQHSLAAELQTLDGKPFRLPQDTVGKWSVVLFGPSWVENPRAPLPGTAKSLAAYAAARPTDDVRVYVAVIDDEIEPVRAHLAEKPLDCPVLVVPGANANPLLRRIGIIAEDEAPNALLLRPDGSVAVVLSGYTMRTKARSSVIQNVIAWHDEMKVSRLLDAGEIEKAKDLVLSLAPVYDPDATDERGRKLRKPTHNLAHLRSRARVFMAMKNFDAALRDAEAVVQRQTATDGGMSLRTHALDEAEALRDAIRKLRDETTR